MYNHTSRKSAGHLIVEVSNFSVENVNRDYMYGHGRIMIMEKRMN